MHSWRSFGALLKLRQRLLHCHLRGLRVHLQRVRLRRNGVSQRLGGGLGLGLRLGLGDSLTAGELRLLGGLAPGVVLLLARVLGDPDPLQPVQARHREAVLAQLVQCVWAAFVRAALLQLVHELVLSFGVVLLGVAVGLRHGHHLVEHPLDICRRILHAAEELHTVLAGEELERTRRPPEFRSCAVAGAARCLPH